MKKITQSYLQSSLLFVLLLLLTAACSPSNQANAESTKVASEEEPTVEATVSNMEEDDKDNEEATEPDEEKVLVIGLSDVAESYDVPISFNPISSMVHLVTYDTLVTFPENSVATIKPNLATNWSISEDNKTYTFNLRDDVTFSNGDSVTAEDVVFSFNRLINMKGNPAFLADAIEDIEAIDELTVEITLEKPRPSFLVELINTAFSVTNKEEVEAAGGTDAEDADSADTAQETFDQTSAGSGPYILESWIPQERTTLVRNKNYWGEQPYFDKIIIRNIHESEAQKIALESGEINLATDIAPDQFDELADNDDLTIHSGKDKWTHFLLMNRDPDIGGPVSDPKVAMAIRYALDYKGFTDLWDGSVTPGTNMWIGIRGAFGPDKAIPRNLVKAKKLLADAGYPDGFEVELSYPDFSFGGINLNTNAEKVQADLAEVGITVTLNPTEVKEALEQYRSGQQGFAYWFWGPDVLDPVDFLSFLPGGKVAEERTNWTADMVDDDINSLIESATTETDILKRQEIFDQLQQFSQKEGAFAPFMVHASRTAFDKNLQGFYFHPEWGFDLSILSFSE